MRRLLPVLFAFLLLVPAETPAGPPTPEVLVDGNSLDAAERRRIRAIRVESVHSGPDAFEIEMRGSRNTPTFTIIEPGMDVEVKVGGESLFSGFVTQVQATVPPRGRPTITVKGFDRLHRLTRTTRSKVWEEMTDVDIVLAIAREHGLEAGIDDTGPLTATAIPQHTQTDLEFLLERAARRGFTLKAGDGTLEFRRRDLTQAPVGVIDATRDLEFTSSEVPGPTQVFVRGRKPLSGEEIVGDATASSSSLGAGQSVTFEVDFPIGTVEEAKAIAQSVLDNLSMDLVTGTVVIQGLPNLRGGSVVDVRGHGVRFDGNYYVTSATHQFTSRGYTTSFIAGRVP